MCDKSHLIRQGASTILYPSILNGVQTMRNTFLFTILAASLVATILLAGNDYNRDKEKFAFDPSQIEAEEPVWVAPDPSSIPSGEAGNEINYGKELIVNTSVYLGPKGSVAHTANGLNCQSCHLEGGTKPFGNNYFAFNSTYPQFRARSGSMETMVKRVNDCFERSMNGKGLDSNSQEMKSILAYMTWLGTGVPKGKAPKGSGITSIPYLDRAADPGKGKLVYDAKCQSCHGADGLGTLKPDGKSYQFPPLWGKDSYNNGAGLFRLSRLAGFVKDNMPLGATHDNPQLTDEEAWDVAAYVNSQPRPEKDISKDWPDISRKPVDHPYGPYSDGFSEQEHKFGPFEPIRKAKQAANKK